MTPCDWASNGLRAIHRPGFALSHWAWEHAARHGVPETVEPVAIMLHGGIGPVSSRFRGMIVVPIVACSIIVWEDWYTCAATLLGPTETHDGVRVDPHHDRPSLRVRGRSHKFPAANGLGGSTGGGREYQTW